MTQPRMRSLYVLAPACLIALVAALGAGRAAHSQEPAASQATVALPSSEVTPAVPELLPSGLLVFVDPATGRILERPRPEQLAALRALRITQAARFGSEEERQRQLDALPRYAVPGGFGVDVEGHFLSAITVHRGPDGELHFGCTDARPEGSEGHDHPTVTSPTGAAAAPPER